MEDNKLSKILFDFIPILFIVLYVFFYDKIVPLSHTALGRFFAILVIIYFVKLDFILGLISCILVIYYYQLDRYESMLNISDSSLWDWTIDQQKVPIFDKYVPYDYNIYNQLEQQVNKDFRSSNCVNGELQKDGFPVNPEMTEYVFPELKFNTSTCNPCDSSCKFSIIEEKLNTEKEILLPKSSNDWVEVIYSRFTTIEDSYKNK
jgi:hypothetical protein